MFTKVSFQRHLQTFVFLLALTPLVVYMWISFNTPNFNYPEVFDDSTYYFAKIKSVLNGDLSQSRAYLIALTPTKPFGFEVLGSLLVGLMSLLFGKSVILGYFFSHSLAIFVYMVALRRSIVTIPKSGLIVATSVIMLIIFKPDYLYRPVLPALSVAAVPVFLHLRFLASTTESLRKNLAPTVFASILMYINLFFAIPMLIYQIYCARKDFLRHSLIIMVITSPLILFSILPAIISSSDDGFRWGVITSRAPGSIKESALGIALLLTLYMNKKRFSNPELWRSLSGIIAVVILLMNSQVLTGKSAEFGSHFGILLNVLSFIIIPYLLFQSKTIRELLVLGGISFVICFTNYNFNDPLQILKQTSTSPNLEVIQNLALVNFPKHSVVAAPSEYAHYIPLYTDAKVLYSEVGVTLFSMSNKEAVERYLLNNYLVKKDNKTEYCSINSDEANGIVRSIFKRRLLSVSQRIDTERKIYGKSQLKVASDVEFNQLVRLVIVVHNENCGGRFEPLIQKYNPEFVINDESNGYIHIERVRS